MKTIEEIDAIIERFEIEDLIDTLRACATRVMALAPHLTLVPSLTGMQLACQHCGEQQPQPLGDLNQVCLTVAGIALRHRRCQPGMSRSTLAPPIKPIEFSNWVASPLTGTAAATIYRILSHLPTPQYARDDIPRDVHDFLRCVDLLDLQNGALCQQSSAGSVVPGVGTQRWQLRLSEARRTCASMGWHHSSMGSIRNSSSCGP